VADSLVRHSFHPVPSNAGISADCAGADSARESNFSPCAEAQDTLIQDWRERALTAPGPCEAFTESEQLLLQKRIGILTAI